jgi:response regulator RpfG family c-di-GMP phosphodiesterase
MSAALPVVLVVDDEVRSQEALRRTLEEDFTVLTAGSADEAAATMAREFVHILLCDQRMPGTSGVDFLKQVRVQWPDTVRIIISGFTEAEDIIAGINEAGIWQYILKPWHPATAADTARRGRSLAPATGQSAFDAGTARQSRGTQEARQGETRPGACRGRLQSSGALGAEPAQRSLPDRREGGAA